MTADNKMLAVIPARGGSKGLPGKNTKLFASLPLIVHSIMLADMCPEIDRLIVSTDSQEIADVARKYGADVPFMRPVELAQDDTPTWPTLRHALESVEKEEKSCYEYLLLLDPTSPGREPEDISKALAKLDATPEADGILGVSQPDFNPIWHCVIEKDGWMTDLFDEGAGYDRRQDVPPVYRIHGSLYIWRAEFVRAQADGWRTPGKHLIYETPEFRSLSFDTAEEFERADTLVENGFINLSWMGKVRS